MSCPCRTVALRIFVRSFADLQLCSPRIVPHPSQVSHRCSRANKTSPTALAPHTYLRSLHRNFGTTAARKTEADRNLSSAGFKFTGPSSGRPSKPRAAKARKPDTRTDGRSGGPEPPPRRESWQSQKAALKAKFPEGWNPRKRLSPDALAGIRALHQQFPGEYTTEALAQKFEVSPEAIRRILKSKWAPSPEEEIERQDRWFSRGKKVWERWAAIGKKPPQRWRKEGVVRDPVWNQKDDGRGKSGRGRTSARQKLSQTLF